MLRTYFARLVFALLLLGSVSPLLAEDAGKSPEEIFKSKGLIKTGFMLIVPQEQALHDSVTVLRAAQGKLAAEAAKIRDADSQIKAAESRLKGMEAEAKDIDQRMAHGQNDNQIIGRHNLLLDEMKDALGKLDELAMARQKLLMSRSDYITATLDASAKADAALHAYDAPAADKELNAAIDKYNLTAKPKVKLGPSAYLNEELSLVKKCSADVSSGSVPVTLEDGVPTVEVLLNDKVTETMIWDSGATGVCLSAKTAADLGIHPSDDDPIVEATIADGSKVKQHVKVLDSIRIGPYTVEHVPCILAAKGTAGADLLGNEIQRHFQFKLDVNAATLQLTPLDPQNASIKPPADSGTYDIPSRATNPVGNPVSISMGNPRKLLTTQLRCEYLENPLGIEEASPRLSWILVDPDRGATQSAYQIEVASSIPTLTTGKADLWDSGQVTSSETIQIEYKGQPLASRQICYWRVRAWNRAGQPGDWSEPASWEMGLLDASDWQAKWIRGSAPLGKKELTIVSAKYETLDGSVAKDVTDVIRSLVHNGMLQTSVTNENLGGDPAENKVKQLHLRYTLDGKTNDDQFGEKAALDIPARPLAYLRRSFEITKPVTRARLYVSALGLYSIEVNGQRAGDHLLAPDWTDYRKRVRYQVYDVTSNLKVGSNAIGAMTACGWYAGHIGNGGFHYWGEQPAMMAQLEMTHSDGSIERINTDDQWQAHAGPILDTDIMMGEDYDARLELADWSAGGMKEDHLWFPIEVAESPSVPMNAQVSPPVRELMTLKAKAIAEPKRGHYLFDLGQNMVGLPRIKLSAPAGTKITIRFAEMLNSDKTIYTTNYRGARSIDTYICKGTGTEIWQPRFTFHGFRYVELTGLPARPDLDAVTGVVLGSDNPAAGQFTCSDPRINQLQSNIQWGQRGNYVSVPTDCPQRDERLGWMGDAQVFIGTAVYNADVSAFFSKWMVDVDDAQASDGQYTNVSPDTGAGAGSPGWGDAGVVCPWTIYRAYGDTRELKRHLPNMMRWVDWQQQHSTNLIRDHDRGSDFGDWLSIGADTPKELMGTAYFAYSTHLVALSAKAVGDTENAAKYSELFDQIKAAFDSRYVQSDGHLTGDTQTCYAMALAFDLLPDQASRVAAASRLAGKVRQNSNHLSTGFLGVSYLLPALSNQGQVDTAYKLLFQNTFPSWLFSVSHGATTIWERWDGWTPDKGFQDPIMNSFNHYSLGSCGQWLFESVAGIAQDADGNSYQHLIMRPRIGGGLSHASGQYNSIRGKISSEWKVQGGRVTLSVSIPPNVSAKLYIPTPSPAGVTESGQPVAKAAGIKVLDAEPQTAVYELQAGTYNFSAAELRAR